MMSRFDFYLSRAMDSQLASNLDEPLDDGDSTIDQSPETDESTARAELAQQWLEAKRAEWAAERKRLTVEKQLLELSIVKQGLPTKGTYRIDLENGDGVKILIASDTVWDQDMLWKVMDLWSEVAPDVAFPFRQELKVDAKVMALVKERMPEQYAKFIEPASTQKAKKPSFSMR